MHIMTFLSTIHELELNLTIFRNKITACNIYLIGFKYTLKFSLTSILGAFKVEERKKIHSKRGKEESIKMINNRENT